MKFIKAFAIAGLFAAPASSVGAATIEIIQSASVPEQSTNYTDVAALPSINKFDASLGKLQSVMLTLKGTVGGSAKLESLASLSGDISWNVQANVSAGVAGFSVSGSIGSGG